MKASYSNIILCKAERSHGTQTDMRVSERRRRKAFGLIVGSEKAVDEDSESQVIPNSVLFVN